MRGAKYGTPFQESEALLAATARDIAYLNDVLNEMSPNERRRLADDAEWLAGMAATHGRAGQGLSEPH